MYQQRGRFGGGGGRRRGRQKETHFEDRCSDGIMEEGEEQEKANRPPPGLRGRDIGMWYAKRSQGKKKLQERMNRPVVNMANQQERHIRKLLDSIKNSDFTSNQSKTSHSNHDDLSAATSGECTATCDDDVNDEDDNDDDVPMEESSSLTELIKYEKAEDEYPIMDSIEMTEDDGTDWDRFTEYPNPDSMFKSALLEKRQDPKYLKMLEFRKKLPSYKMKEEILEKVKNNQVVVISGETGCGKTTQVPQFILDDYILSEKGSHCRVICTQPRRISAVSVAERVASERCEVCGDNNSIGYQIRLESRLPRRNGSVLYCTTGIVLKFLESDRYLKRATHIIIDEIHERDLLSDFLMIILKDLLPRRPDLKVILMSATLNAEMFSKYFSDAPMLNIPGYTFPVTEFHLEDVIKLLKYTPKKEKKPEKRRRRSKNEDKEEEKWNFEVWCRNLKGDYPESTIHSLQVMDFDLIDLDLIAQLIRHISVKEKEGAILVFVPGWEQISSLNKILLNDRLFNSGKFRIIPLHSLMPTVNQKYVFDTPPPGVRKIVIATNIAETSITIDDVVFVIDCGKIKVKDFQPEKNLSTLEPQWVAKANSKQRKGRAGRVQAGVCYHLYTRFHWDTFRDYIQPEILRTRLEELCLQIKLLKLGKIVPFVSKAMQPPSMESLQLAIVTLQNLNALDKDESLLPLGYHLARMPVDPQTGKMILFAAMFSCLDPILTIAASLSFKDAFLVPLGCESEVDEIKRHLSDNTKSDHLMLVNAFQGWEKSLKSGNDQNYCWEHFLSSSTLKLLRDMKKQLAELLFDLGFVRSRNPHNPESNIYSDNHCLVKAVLCAGLYPNVAKVHKCPKPKNKFGKVILRTKKDGKVSIHPKSVNAQETDFKSKWIVYCHKLKTTQIYVHDCTMVSPYPLLFFGGEITIGKDDDQDVVVVDDWIIFQASPETAHLVKDLRKELDLLLEHKITNPGPTNWNTSEREGAIMKAISDLIATEDLEFHNSDSSTYDRTYPDSSASGAMSRSDSAPTKCSSFLKTYPDGSLLEKTYPETYFSERTYPDSEHRQSSRNWSSYSTDRDCQNRSSSSRTQRHGQEKWSSEGYRSESHKGYSEKTSEYYYYHHQGASSGDCSTGYRGNGSSQRNRRSKRKGPNSGSDWRGRHKYFSDD